MAHTKVKPHERVVERNIILSGKIMQFLMENPQVFSSLPEKFDSNRGRPNHSAL
jgi:hypothetical protein